ncbi:MAG: hypothetical protein H7318_09860 [Oligoflexus sp.]|nr:hypothetical protein [Oligoflexus sp.]
MIEVLRFVLTGLGLTQAILMLVDEGIFHHKRGLEKFERWGHVADTGLFFIAISVPALFAPTTLLISIYGVLAVASCLLITKDEWIHAEACEPLEHWCHAMLFILHGALLAVIGVLWNLQPDLPELKALPVAVFFWGLYQHLYWNVYYVRSSH